MVQLGQWWFNWGSGHSFRVAVAQLGKWWFSGGSVGAEVAQLGQ